VKLHGSVTKAPAGDVGRATGSATGSATEHGPIGPRAVSWFRSHVRRTTALPVGARAGTAGALSTPGMGDRLGVEVPWRKRWC
jgi:hypothetical protein